MRPIGRSRVCAIQDLARRWRRSPNLVATVTLMSACLAPPRPWAPGDGQLLAPLDSAALARETGRRDALLQRQRTAAGATSLISTIGVTAGLLVRRPGANDFWVAPATIATVSAGGALWAYGETRRPVPAPPDSMRSRYGLTDDRLWRSYRDGFRDEIEERRRVELAHASRAALLNAIVFAGTYTAFSPLRR